MMEFTPPVQVIYATRRAIEEFWTEGEEKKYARHRRVFDRLHDGLQKLGFIETVPRELQSGLVISVKYPNDPVWNFDKIHDYCFKRGFTIYDSNSGTFRVCSLGAIDVPDIEEFFKVFKEALLANGIAVPVKYN
jgi:2-aminoethylphosphonate-pyruvate transaminase